MSMSQRRRFSQYWAGNPSNGSFGFSPPAIHRANQYARELEAVLPLQQSFQIRTELRKLRAQSAPPSRPRNSVDVEFYSQRDSAETPLPQLRSYSGYSENFSYTSSRLRPAHFAPGSVDSRTPAAEEGFTGTGKFEDLEPQRMTPRISIKTTRREPTQGSPERSYGNSGALRHEETTASSPTALEQQIYDEWSVVSAKRKHLSEARAKLRQQQERLSKDGEKLRIAKQQLQEDAEQVALERHQLQQQRQGLQRDAPMQEQELDRLRGERARTGAMVEAIALERRKLCQERLKAEDELKQLQRELEASGHHLTPMMPDRVPDDFRN
ncbi:hypothetical protein CYMTET_44412 [Cymbomonas tetramitiformis]|uniref:Uncharacterized protein n=1 Tax=Cymbomonas tetramitiformis TaxID=36881 RepID=A0AAE0C0B7_9CHLO|nr:hypothetical protein CYMTET_44412 [Cymbomonas tetramitiformis]